MLVIQTNDYDQQLINSMSEKEYSAYSCFSNFLIFLLLIIISILGFVLSFVLNNTLYLLTIGIIALIAGILYVTGFVVIQPNEALVVTLCGNYIGTTRKTGCGWVNPFSTKTKVSLKAQNLNSPILKVNDKRGNPIEIAAVIVWRVEDTAKALFSVQNCSNYVKIQSESAIRHLASSFAYDSQDVENEVTLLNGSHIIQESLKKELKTTLINAGVTVEEARISHLAYSTEIAGVMLKRQQADAIIAARKKIVFGAVSMVEMSLNELKNKGIVNMTEDRKATIAGNLLVVLCSDTQTNTVLPTGN